MARGQVLVAGFILLSSAPGNCPEAKAEFLKKTQLICAPTASIRAGLQVCKENNAFVESAKSCLELFRKTVSAHSQALPTAFASSSSESQRLKFSDTLTDYRAAILDFQNLIATNHLADRELNLYLGNLVMPFNLRDQLDVPCLGDSVDSIRADLKKLRQEREQLEHALNVAKVNYKLAANSRSGLEVDSSTPAAILVKGRAPASAAPKVVRRPKQGPSDLTGTTTAIEQAARARVLISR